MKKENNKNKRALVLSGGGAKGAYQIGVWKAIRELGIKIDIVTGSSIGSINAAMFAQNKYFLAKRLWKKINTDDLFDADVGNSNYKEYIKLFEDIFKNGGMSFSNAEYFLNKYINEKKVRKSKIDYGLVTYSLTTKKPRILTKDKIPNGQLLDYIIASSTCFPAVEKKIIDGEAFIDGGIYDNMPINLAIDMGATEIIAVDLNVIGNVQKVKDEAVKIDIIKCKDPKKFTLSFNHDYTLAMMQMGYNDTMKHFEKLDGDIFTFHKGDLDRNYKKIKKYYISLLNDLLLSGKKNKIVTEIFNITKYNNLFTKIKDNIDITDTVNSSLEYLGEIFEIDKKEIYNIETFNKLLLKEVKNLKYLKLSKGLKGKMLIGYMYNKYVEADDKEVLSKEIFNTALIFKKEFLGTVYLISLSEKYPLTLKSDEFYQEILKYLKG